MQRQCVYAVTLSILCAGWAMPQQATPAESQLGARQLFFLNVEKPAAKTGPAAKSTPAKSATTKAPTTRVPKPEGTANRTPSTRPEPETSSKNRDSGPAVMVNAADRAPMIGLRYSLLKVGANGSTSEVPFDNVFHSGDQVRLRLEANRPGYLYVVQKGSSGRWELLYPTPRMEPVAVAARQAVTVPSGEDAFEFDATPGTEQLFVVLSSRPEETLEHLLGTVRPHSAPAGTPPVQMAMNRTPVLEGSDFESVRRTLIGRDLKVEKVKAKPGDTNAENAVYVVAPVEDGRVAADFSLEHR